MVFFYQGLLSWRLTIGRTAGEEMGMPSLFLINTSIHLTNTHAYLQLCIKGVFFVFWSQHIQLPEFYLMSFFYMEELVFSQTLNCILITDIMLRFVDLTLINSIFELSSTITLPSQTHRLTKRATHLMWSLFHLVTAKGRRI